VSATAKFYTAFVIALLLVVGGSFYAGYRFGLQHERVETRHVVPHLAPTALPAP
jgi:ABC-type arginine transport system permease subunit